MKNDGEDYPEDYDLPKMTWREAEALRLPNAVGLWAVGSCEAHGPHLPLGTDLLIAQRIMDSASNELCDRGYRPLSFPELTLGVTEYAAEFQGTLGISAATLKAIVGEVAAGAARHGLRRLALVNVHLEPAHLEALAAAARAASEGGRITVVAPNPCEPRWARTLGEEFKRGECHAGRFETSLVLDIEPEWVRKRVAAALPPVPIDLAKAMREGRRTFREAGAEKAYFGRPAEASVEEGRELFDRLVAMVVTEVLEKLPLSQC
ncbi:MAG: creatininase family protein [Myxococcales bacterium]